MKQEQLEQKKTMVRQMIYDENYIPLKFGEMAYLMNVPKKEREDLRQVLTALEEEGSIECTVRGKYVKSKHETVVGTFSGTARGFGFVTVDGREEDIFIPASEVNGAFHKDEVLVRLKSGEILPGMRQEGRIVKIRRRGTAALVGTFQKSRNFGFVIPDDKHCGTDIFIGKKHMRNARHNDKVLVKLMHYGSDHRKPEGEITEVIGGLDDPAADVEAIMKSYGIPAEFPEDVGSLAGRVPQTVVGPFHSKRHDYRNLLTVTIDGEDARDLDDAITLEKRDGYYYLGVHIADVAEYVKEGSVLDQEALRRGTSVYLADRVIPMLPRELSNGICSLNAGTDRLAMTCMMQVDSQGHVVNHEISESVIRVDRRMSYSGVNAILKGEDHPEGDREDVSKLCHQMFELASILKERRRQRGSIDFDFPESKIIVDEYGKPTDIYPYERNAATDLIEDFMLLANQTVAEDYFWQEIPFLYRTHETPDADRIRQLDTFIRNFGYYMKTGREHFHPKEIQKLLFSLEGEPEEALISRLALRSMKRARYTTLNIGHFGLSVQYYTHFTSPIRRYPDLQIHRIIKENIHGRLGSSRLEHYENILPAVAEHSSRMERQAQDAERDVDKLKKIEYIQEHIGETYSGIISGVTSWGFYVELDHTIEGCVSISALTDDYYRFDEKNYQLIGETGGNVYTIGQQVDIVVAAADKMAKTIDFCLKEYEEDFRQVRSSRYMQGNSRQFPDRHQGSEKKPKYRR